MTFTHLQKKIGARLSGESEAGFTLIELLIVMLILGILAAIALPAFFNQKSKAGDAKAKEYVHSAQVAAETYSTEHSGGYAGISKTALEAIEPTLSSAPALAVTVVEAGLGYKVEVEGSTGQKFWAERTKTGSLLFECKTAGTGGCPAAESTKTYGNWSKG